LSFNKFFRDFELSKPIETGLQWFLALVWRLGDSMLLGIPYMAPGLRDRFRERMTVTSAWVLVIALAAWLVTSVYPNPVTSVINLILAGLGIIELGSRLGDIGKNLMTWLSGAYAAKTEADLEQAGRAFGSVFDEAVYTGLELLITSKVFRAAERLIAGRFPIPEWFSARWREIWRRTASAEDASHLREEESRPRERDEERQNREEAKPKEEETPAQKVKAALQGPGAQVPPFPTWPVVGSVLGIAAIAGGGLAASYLATKGKADES
jgi:hypothetical protein